MPHHLKHKTACQWILHHSLVWVIANSFQITQTKPKSLIRANVIALSGQGQNYFTVRSGLQEMSRSWKRGLMHTAKIICFIHSTVRNSPRVWCEESAVDTLIMLNDWKPLTAMLRFWSLSQSISKERGKDKVEKCIALMQHAELLKNLLLSELIAEDWNRNERLWLIRCN